MRILTRPKRRAGAGTTTLSRWQEAWEKRKAERVALEQAKAAERAQKAAEIAAYLAQYGAAARDPVFTAPNAATREDFFLKRKILGM